MSFVTKLRIGAICSLPVMLMVIGGISPSGADDPKKLEGCAVEARQEDSPGPAFVNQVVRVHFNATHTNPTNHAECEAQGPTFSWTIVSVERRAPGTDTWESDPYEPQKIHNTPTIARGHIVAYFPRPGDWRIKMSVTATWTSESCTSCSATDDLMILCSGISGCSFTGKVTMQHDFAGRSTGRIGLGEAGSLSVVLQDGTTLESLIPLTWSQVDGNTIELDNVMPDGTATFHSRRATGSNTFELSSAATGCSVSLTIDVIAPTGAHHEYLRDVAGSELRLEWVKYGIENKVWLEPADVSFGFIQVGEGRAVGQLSGSFLAFEGTANQIHPENGPYDVTAASDSGGSAWATEDIVELIVFTPLGDGGNVWPIDQHWLDDFQGRHTFCTLEQSMQWKSPVFITLSKGGVSKLGPPVGVNAP